MDHIWPDPRVPVRRTALGTVTIGSRSPSIAGVGSVAIPGGTAYCDPADSAGPGSIPYFEIADVDVAYEFVADLLGADVADVCARLDAEGIADSDTGGDPDHDTATTAEMTAVATPVRPLDWLRDLASLHWLDLQAPWPLDEPILQLETVVLAERLAPWLDGDDNDDDPAVGYLPLIDPVCAALELPGELPAQVSGLLIEAADSMLAALSSSDPRRTRVEYAVGTVAGSSASATRSGDFGGVVATCVPELALSMGQHGSGRTFFDTDAVDWRFVRRGIVGRDETAMSWVLDMSADHPEFSVSVAAADRLDSVLDLSWSAWQPSHLECVSYAGDQPVVLGSGRLHARPDQHAWVGTIPVGRDTGGLLAALRAGGLRVVVHEPGRRPAPISAAARVAAAARRWGSRGVCAARISAVDGDSRSGVLDASRAALTRARGLWRILPGTAAAARARRCEELIESLTQGTFESRPSVAESLGSVPAVRSW